MTVVTPAEDYTPAVYGPPGWSLLSYTEGLNWRMLAHPHYRRWATGHDPLLFALTYLGRSMLVSDETGPDIHLSQFHVDLARAARRWVDNDFGPAELRECWVAPRGAAKSTWTDALTLWAMAFRHMEFILGFAANDSSAAIHVDTIRTELRENELLNEDFPELCTAAKVDGKTRADTRNSYVAQSGVGLSWWGIDGNRLGSRLGRLRPKLILLDDIESDEGNYSLTQKQARLSTVESILPMNENAPVLWVGTTTMYGSLVHDLVRVARGVPVDADWVTDDEWTVRYYPPLVPDAEGELVSMWPARWSTEYLRAQMHKRSFALHYANNPHSAEDGLWTPADIAVVSRAALGAQVLAIDPGVKSRQRNDPTGLAVVSYGSQLVVEWADGRRLSPAELKEFVAQAVAGNPRLTTVIIETNQGGDHWANLLRPVIPYGIELVEVHHATSKYGRFERLLDFYQDGRIVHAAEFGELHRQLLAYPKVDHDDVIDAVCLAAEHLLGREWRPPTTGRRRR